MIYDTDDLRINETKELTTPLELLADLPIDEKASRSTYETRQAIHNILSGDDDRLLVIAGPCSIHDTEAAKEYASRLLALKEQHQKDLLIVMRVYFEKPRTTVGWKGLINDPDLDGSFHINKGLHLARKLLIDLNDMGIAAGVEFLDVITAQYVTDLVCWGAIGARTTESQVHRELSSGLSCPVGFKNATYGTIKVAIDAIGAASEPHHFLSVRKEGNLAIFSTTGNKDCHVILRGGKQPNYGTEHITQTANDLAAANLPQCIMVDLSHANSSKQHKNQILVGHNICDQLASGEKSIFGVMIESHLVEGRQDVVEGKELTYGQSITDACLGWEDTISLISDLANAVNKRRTAG